MSENNTHYWEGRERSEETKRKISESSKGKKYKIVKCPHCGQEGGENLMKRYHFDNCKYKFVEILSQF